MLSASRRQPHLLHVSAVDRRQTWSMVKSWRCVTLSGFLHSHIVRCRWNPISCGTHYSGPGLSENDSAGWMSPWLGIIWWRLSPSSTSSGIAQTTVEGHAVNWCHKSVEGRLAIGYGGQFHFSGRSHNPTSRFWSSQTSVARCTRQTDRRQTDRRQKASSLNAPT